MILFVISRKTWKNVDLLNKRTQGTFTLLVIYSDLHTGISHLSHVAININKLTADVVICHFYSIKSIIISI